MENDEWKLKNIPRMSQRRFRSSIGKADDTEEFATEKWDNIKIDHYIEIETKVSIPGFIEKTIPQFISKFKHIPIKYNSTVKFIIKSPYNNAKIKWFWKVRNVGGVAISKNMIRGQIINDNSLIHVEPINFSGNHFVEIYGVKNNIVCAFGRLEVKLGDVQNI
ncbi:hypothetical protein HCZ80_08925 [Limosilactobacillus fermentum]|jgi:hypothetical protein|uniref:Adenylyl/Guanylyl and SMODS C-terminal sensor domain-containing protein n=1 Tax=Levilactobacillus tongjiangensis TaxID=2486023 RepID=A0ABW1SRB0_9LACO|nr:MULTISPECIES: hypothetical protein [Lactobacillaceae]MDN3985706.1 hypothetical protein [Lactiplantibacillus plantarum]MDV2586148.1 hypothetical protein [Levilactobacillus brevis]